MIELIEVRCWDDDAETQVSGGELMGVAPSISVPSQETHPWIRQEERGRDERRESNPRPLLSIKDTCHSDIKKGDSPSYKQRTAKGYIMYGQAGYERQGCYARMEITTTRHEEANRADSDDTAQWYIQFGGRGGD